MATKTKVDIDITPDMLAAGLQVLVDSGVLDQGATSKSRIATPLWTTLTS
jgi:hypothetical protein